jgi:hypothetical protein
MSTNSNQNKEDGIKMAFARMGVQAIMGTVPGTNDAKPPGDMDGVFRSHDAPDDLNETFGQAGIAKRFDNWIQYRIKCDDIQEMPNYKACFQEFNLLLKWRVPENIERLKKVKAEGRPGVAVIPCVMSIPLSEVPPDEEFKKFGECFNRRRAVGKFFEKKKCVVCPMMAFVKHKERFVVAFQVQFFMPDEYEQFKDMYD